MQNNLEVTSTSQFWIPIVHIVTKHFFKCIFTKMSFLGIQTEIFDMFNVLLSFLVEKGYRTNIKFLTLRASPPAPSGLRWFRFKTLPIFQLGGFTLPPTPFPGLWFEGIAGCNRTFIRCSFRAPFFSPLGTPQNRYHKLFRLQSDPILRSKTGSKTSSHFGTGFFSNFSRFSHFFHTTSSASRIAPAISKPHFRLSSFLLFLLSLRPSF